MKILKKKLAKQIVLMLATGMIMTAPQAQALPSQGTLDNSAVATITTDMANKTMNIAGKGKNNIINWASFNIDKGERVNFADKNNYLNLVHGVDMSRIYGTISGGNAVYLVNPNGILFAEGATLDNVGGFVASTRNISSINKEAFLNDPSNTTAVLGVDNPVMDNKDYYPEGSLYVPKITMADIQLTNVPESATVILDGPGGVVLKSKDLLDKVSHVVTRQIGGELGFGYEGGIADLSLTDAEKEKVSLVNGDKYYGKDSVIPYPVRSYKWIRNWDELKAYSDINVNKMLVNDINLTGYTNTIKEGNGILDGLGYTINKMKMNNDNLHTGTFKDEKNCGLFGCASGEIRNLNFNGINIDLNDVNQINRIVIGSLAANTKDCLLINNVNIEGNIKASKESWIVGGVVGINSDDNVEIRNTSSQININVAAEGSTVDSVGGIVGRNQSYNLQMYNVINNGNISHYKNVDNDGNTYYIGGIIGTNTNNEAVMKILGCENKGDIYINSNIANYSDIYIGGIFTSFVSSYNKDKRKIKYVLDCYNLGKVFLMYPFTSNEHSLHIGGIGAIDESRDDYLYYTSTSNITGNELPSYYIENSSLAGENIIISSFGEVKRADELLLDYNLHDMIGVNDFSVQHTWPPTPPSGGDTGGGTTNPPSGGNTGGGTTNPPSGGNTGSGTTNPPSGGDTGGGTTNPPGGGNTGSGTTNPPGGGNTGGGGTTNPPSEGNTGGGTTNPPSGGNTGENSENTSKLQELINQWYYNRDHGITNTEVEKQIEEEKKKITKEILDNVEYDIALDKFNELVDINKLLDEINKIHDQLAYEEKHADEIRVNDLYDTLTNEIERALYDICKAENKKNKTEEFNNLSKVINLDGIPKSDKNIILKTVGGMLKEAFDESISSSQKSIPTDQQGMVEYAYNLISSNIKVDEKVVTGENGTYSISYNRAQGALVINGTGNKNSSISLVGNSGAAEALANYTVALAELNTEVWTDVVSQCVDATGVVVQGKVKTLASQIALGLMMPEGERKEQYIDKVNQNVSNMVKGDAANQARDLVSTYIPGGKDIIAAADLIGEAKGEYSKYMNMSSKEKEADKSYAAFQNVCEQAAKLLGVLY